VKLLVSINLRRIFLNYFVYLWNF